MTNRPLSPLRFDDAAGVKLCTEMPNWLGVSSEKFRGAEVWFKTEGVSSTEGGDTAPSWSPSQETVLISAVAICNENISTTYKWSAREPQGQVEGPRGNMDNKSTRLSRMHFHNKWFLMERVLLDECWEQDFTRYKKKSLQGHANTDKHMKIYSGAFAHAPQ